MKLCNEIYFYSFIVSWPCFLFKPPELKIWASIPSRGLFWVFMWRYQAWNKYCTHGGDSCHRRSLGADVSMWFSNPRALPRASGTAFQSFVAHIMPPSPVPCHHINMLAQSYHEYCRWMIDGRNHGFRIILQFLVYQNTALFSSVCPPSSVRGVTSQLFFDNLMV